MYKGFVCNAKYFNNYENLTTIRKLKFWIRMPIYFIKKLLIKKRYL